LPCNWFLKQKLKEIQTRKRFPYNQYRQMLYLTGVAPVTGAVTPAIAATEIVVAVAE